MGGGDGQAKQNERVSSYYHIQPAKSFIMISSRGVDSRFNHSTPLHSSVHGSWVVIRSIQFFILPQSTSVIISRGGVAAL